MLKLRAAQQEFEPAQFKLIAVYMGDGKDGAGAIKAVQMLQKMVANGNARSMHQLGILYTKGVGAEVNFVEAAKLYERAAEMLYLPAIYAAAMPYLAALGVEKDLVKGFMYIDIAYDMKFEQALKFRNSLRKNLSALKIAEALKLKQKWLAEFAKITNR